jgi:hypothetical protein
MFASREIFVIVVRLWFHSFTIKDALAICPECLCCYVFRFGFTPYNPVFIFLEIYVITLFEAPRKAEMAVLLLQRMPPQ